MALHRHVALVILLSLTAMVPVAAAQSPQNDAQQIRSLVAVGQAVVITDDRGGQVEGRVETFSADRLTVVSRRVISEVDYNSIVRIDRPRDGLGNGALWGFGIGAGVGLAAIIAEESRECEPLGFFSCGDPEPGAYVVVPLVFGGIGAAIGVGIDAAIRRERNIYQRGAAPRVSVMPALGRSRRGVVVALSW